MVIIIFEKIFFSIDKINKLGTISVLYGKHYFLFFSRAFLPVYSRNVLTFCCIILHKM